MNVISSVYISLAQIFILTLYIIIAIAVRQATFGGGAGSILLSGVRCTGTESSLLRCGHYGIGVHYCSHSNDAGVVCPTRKSCICFFLLSYCYSEAA